jgi:hypothetical protein
MSHHKSVLLLLLGAVLALANRQRWGRIEPDYTFRGYNLKTTPAGSSFFFFGTRYSNTMDFYIILYFILQNFTSTGGQVDHAVLMEIN